ncbi:MAG: ABC transporter ATP-binding protein [Candidatus Izemoplasmataceae bacterium]|jgi:iron(III) transport system ATP-binding protein
MYVKIDELSFSYDRKTKVLQEISFGMNEGEIVAILGSSGSGKSTLLRVLSGLEMPNKGKITINEETMCSTDIYIDAEKREVGMVFQDYALFPHMNVYKNILFGLNHLPKSCRANRVDEMLDLVNLPEKKLSYPHELSGGQMQRVALARALAPKPKMLLLDEPFSNLDADLKMKIRQDLRRIIKASKMTSIFVTHDYEDAYDIADRIVYLENGKIVREEIIEQKDKTAH